MDGITYGRTLLLCTLLLWVFQVVSSGNVNVVVKPKVEVLKEENASLPCTVTPLTTGTIVEWYIDLGTRTRIAFCQGKEKKVDPGTPLTDRIKIGEDFTLTISSVKPSDELNFTCQVTDPAGSPDGTTSLKVFSAPEHPKLTTSQAITAGIPSSSEVGTCETKNGFPLPRIVWFRDAKPLPEVKDKQEKTYMVAKQVKETSGLITVTSSLYMQPMKEDKDSEFYCTVEYSMPGNKIETMDSNRIKINLNYPSDKIYFSLFNTSQPVKEGDTVTMKCETDGNPQPPFEFTKNGEEAQGKDGLLILKSVKRSDAAQYKCTALDFEIEFPLEKTIALTVDYIDPVKVTPAVSKVVMLGDKAAWQCRIKASRNHTVQWKKGSEVLSQNGTLSIQNVSYQNAGEYVCVGAVPSVPGLMSQASVNLTVKGKPVIDPPAPVKVGKEGDKVTLMCVAYGVPTPNFTWQPSGGEQSITVKGNKWVSTLTLKTTADMINGGVTCEVENEHGKDITVFPLSLEQVGSSAEVLLSGNPVLTSAGQGGSSAVVIAVVVCVLLLLLLVGLLYCLSKNNKLSCSKKDPKEVNSGMTNSSVVVELKTDKLNEEDGLLNKKNATEQ
ncbi:basal cell adhesion molecule isoform X1 [Pundamilia nyererei]|uniref:Basal cell adhesion molecule isoform X1 n=1 Tax=Pundamilia nyererei TaxID=303518 RepID=A0A9Y3RCA6_9CICH|nr:PREDICTED: basal cell adhesion molecule-like isoform X1 [Pundamilia nyererei]